MAFEWVIMSIYNLVNNYGVAIILFTILVKLLLLPLNIKSQKAMKKQQKIQPLLAELQKKYANDQQKLQQETMKLYKENNVSMMGGCLPLLIQMPILIALYRAIQRMMGREGINYMFLGLDLSKAPNEIFARYGEEHALAGQYMYLSDPIKNLSVILLILIPIIAIVSSVLQSKISMKLSGQDKNKNEQAQSTNAMMMWMMPLMTGFFTYSLAAGIGLYWIISGIVQIVQQLALNYYFDKKGEDFVVKVPEKRTKHGKNSKKH